MPLHGGEAVAGREIDAGLPFLGAHLFADRFDDFDRGRTHWRGHGVAPLEWVLSQAGPNRLGLRIPATSVAAQASRRSKYCNAAIANALRHARSEAALLATLSARVCREDNQRLDIRSTKRVYGFNGKSALRSVALEIPISPVKGLSSSKQIAQANDNAYQQRGHDDQIGLRKQGEAHENRAEPKNQND